MTKDLHRELEEKIWWRGFKVLLIVFLVSLFGLGMLGAWGVSLEQVQIDTECRITYSRSNNYPPCDGGSLTPSDSRLGGNYQEIPVYEQRVNGVLFLGLWTIGLLLSILTYQTVRLVVRYIAFGKRDGEG